MYHSHPWEKEEKGRPGKENGAFDGFPLPGGVLCWWGIHEPKGHSLHRLHDEMADLPPALDVAFKQLSLLALVPPLHTVENFWAGLVFLF